MRTKKESPTTTGKGNTDETKIQRKNRYKKSDAVKELERIADKAARIKNPTMPIEWLAPRTYSDKTANGLTKCIIDFIRYKGYQAERISTTGRIINNQKTFVDVVGRTQIVGQAAYWIPTSGSRGSADISSVLRGKSVKIEVKINRDRQSDYQKNYERDILRAGGIYLIIRTFEQFYNWFNNEAK